MGEGQDIERKSGYGNRAGTRGAMPGTKGEKERRLGTRRDARYNKEAQKQRRVWKYTRHQRGVLGTIQEGKRRGGYGSRAGT